MPVDSFWRLICRRICTEFLGPPCIGDRDATTVDSTKQRIFAVMWVRRRPGRLLCVLHCTAKHKMLRFIRTWFGALYIPIYSLASRNRTSLERHYFAAHNSFALSDWHRLFVFTRMILECLNHIGRSTSLCERRCLFPRFCLFRHQTIRILYAFRIHRHSQKWSLSICKGIGLQNIYLLRYTL